VTPERWLRTKEILAAAWERETSDRSAFLDRACADDPQLRSAVESLLACDKDAGTFLDTPAMELRENKQAEGSREYWSGRLLGPYRILREIGHGGMGTVYLAERADGHYRKQVAIKLVSSHFATQEVLRRFRNERQVEASLDHPNIARLLDGGSTEDGHPYLVMEYVEGTRIDSWCDGRKLSLRDRIKLFRQVCAGVQAAHEKDIIHRDIKPGNILVTADATPKLLDFGIAKVLNRELSDATETTVGVGPMTPEYASPEQVRGERVGTASDIYALGIVLYELLTGQFPYPVRGADLRTMARLICEQEPVKPSVAIQHLHSDSGRQTAIEARNESPAALRRRLAGDLDNIVLKALRKEPDRRYTSAAQFSEDLQRFLQDLPVQARRESWLYRCRKFLKRNRVASLAAAASALVVLSLVTGLQRFGQSRGSVGVVRSIAVLPLEDSARDPQQDALVEGMTDALIGNLGKIGILRVISRDSVMRYKDVHQPPGQTARELKASALVEGSVQRIGERVRATYRLTGGPKSQLLWTETYERDFQDVLAMQSDVARAIAREIQVRLTPQEEARLSSNPVNEQAFKSYLRGRYQMYKHTREGLEKSLQHFKEAIDIDPAYAQAWAGLADSYYELSTAVLPPAEAMPKARAAALKALSIDPNMVEANATIAQVQAQYDWDWATAEKSYKRALELNPSYAQGHQYYGWYLAEMGRLDDAIREMAEAERLDPVTPWRATNIAWLYYLARHTGEAIARDRKILDLDPDSAVTHYSLGQAFEQKGMFEQAIAEFLKARSLDGNCGQCLALLGHAYGASGKKEEALRTLRELLKPSGEYVDGYWVGMIYAGLSDTSKAFEWFEKAYQDRSEELLFLKVDPRLDFVHSDPRYQSLVRRIGLGR
jgi:serine/threonine protein kinase/TolB-like protein/Tfp pilus assembly protein PilF